MNTKKILSLIVALAMIVTAVPMFGLVASAADLSFAGPFEQSAGKNGTNQTVARYFGPVSGEVTITYDVVFNVSGSELVGNDFVGFGSTSVSSVPCFGVSAIGMQGTGSGTVAFRSGTGTDNVGAFEPTQGETYSVSITTDTTKLTYSGTVTKDGETISSFTDATYRATGTTSLNAFMNFNNGSTSGRVTVSNLVIKAGADYAEVAVPTEPVVVDELTYDLSGDNLITNPGFELTDGTFSMGGWLSSETNGTFGATSQEHSFRVYDGGYAYLDGTSETTNADYAPYDGTYSLGTRWDDGPQGLCSFYNDFAVEANSTYYLSFWVKAYAATDCLVWAGAVANTGVTATSNDDEAVWIANDDDNDTHIKVNASEWTQVQQIITTGEDQTAIQVNAYWLGENSSKPNFVFDNFVLAKAALSADMKTVTATYTVGDETVYSVSGTYDPEKYPNGYTFPEKYYSANGSNTLYYAEETTLAESKEIPMDALENKGLTLGSYVVSGSQTYKTVSANLIPNGDFSIKGTNGAVGWYNRNGNEATATITTDTSVSGNVLALGGINGAASTNSLGAVWSVDKTKTYVMDFDINTTVSSDSGNYVKVRGINTTDAISEDYAKETSLIDIAGNSEWTHYTAVINPTTAYISLCLSWANVSLANVGLYEVEQAPTLTPALGWNAETAEFTVDFLFGGTSTVAWDVTVITSSDDEGTTKAVEAGQEGFSVSVDSNVPVAAYINDSANATAATSVYALVAAALADENSGFGTDYAVAADQIEVVNKIINHGGVYLYADGTLNEDAAKIMSYNSNTKTATLNDTVIAAGVTFAGGETSVIVDDDSFTATDVEGVMLLEVELVYEPATEDAAADADVEAAFDFDDIL